MFENLLQMSTDTGHLELAAAHSGLQRCSSQLPLSGTELLLIVPACDSCRHPHHMDTGFHSRQNWNCTWLPTAGNNLLQKFAETQREVKSHRATEQMQCIRHLPRQGTPHQGHLGTARNLGVLGARPLTTHTHQHTLQQPRLAFFNTKTTYLNRGQNKPIKQPSTAPGLHNKSTSRLHLICGNFLCGENNAIRKQLL